ncbi:MAG: PKD domain-containing protein, partial [Phycisphaerae bacterium]|nr:PKD domain-containing protein [Phycisphaerae bacterium]
AIAFLALLLSISPAVADPDDWWDSKWDYRAHIECPAGPGDVATVTVNTASRSADDGRDLRVVDAAGRLRPFDILHHDPLLNTTLRFQVPPDEASTVWLYYGNSSARESQTNYPDRQAQQEAREAWSERQRQREQIAARRRPLEEQLAERRRNLAEAEASGQDATARSHERQIARIEAQLADIGQVPDNPRPVTSGPWQPERGVLLRIYRKARSGHPETIGAFRALLRRSELEGAAYRPAISDGFNPFGSSEEYLSVYDAYLRIDNAGEYGFCTVSDDGSWLYINNRLVVEWPGAHSFEGSERGEHSGVVRLTEGIVHVEYYHEEGDGGQMAFVGWKPPDDDRYSAIPRQQWPAVRTAGVAQYEARNQHVFAVPDVQVLNTFWAPDSKGLQATLVRCTDRSQAERGKIASAQWSFGDGLNAAGSEVEHVYFRLGRPQITLTVADERGHGDSVTCAPRLFAVDVVAAYFNYGTEEQYRTAAAGYDADKLDHDDLATYADFWRLVEDWPQHARAAAAFVTRFPGDERAPALAFSGTTAALEPACYDPNAADTLLRLTAGKAARSFDRQCATVARADLLTWHLARPTSATPLYTQVYNELKGNDRPAMRDLARHCQIGLADVALLNGAFDDAERLYRAIPPRERRPVDQPEVLAKAGSNPYLVTDLMSRGEYEWARRWLDRWEDESPVQKLEGYTFFLRGKVLFIEHPSPLALRYLELAERVAPKAIHVPEAVWLRANCLMALKRYDEAMLQFARISQEFTYSEFYERIDDKIRECQQARDTANASD